MLLNVFGFDRKAAQIYFVTPAPFTAVLKAKNLSIAMPRPIEPDANRSQASRRQNAALVPAMRTRDDDSDGLRFSRAVGAPNPLGARRSFSLEFVVGLIVYRVALNSAADRGWRERKRERVIAL